MRWTDLLSPVSCALHYAIFGEWRALCSRARTHQHTWWGRVLRRVFGPAHLQESWEYWHDRRL